MVTVVMKRHLIIAVLFGLSLTLTVDAKPQLYSCTLKVKSSNNCVGSVDFRTTG